MSPPHQGKKMLQSLPPTGKCLRETKRTWSQGTRDPVSCPTHGTPWVAFSSSARILGECSTSHSPPFFRFQVAISSRTLISLFRPGSVHCGSASWDDCDRVFPDEAIGPHEDLLTIVKRRKLQWYGHVSRSSGLAKTILQGTVKGGRRQGGQRKRWEDNIRE